MIEAEDHTNGKMRKLIADQVVANAVFFFIVGFDTSLTLSWCSYYLAINNDIQEKVRREINENIKRNEEIQYSDLDKLQYMEQVMLETLRPVVLKVGAAAP
ncbi:probable cytochrome P450 6a13 [Centruroides sculpturatus]|uniref:probable cytochrome P450 6a13 n=1 Tax=Centruroides sculpturatus TaxID=218467 RepID=UPI000C6DB82E|nr:probable cytochrome P450 6a13 [Centruroides sculpturatus]